MYDQIPLGHNQILVCRTECHWNPQICYRLVPVCSENLSFPEPGRLWASPSVGSPFPFLYFPRVRACDLLYRVCVSVSVSRHGQEVFIGVPRPSVPHSDPALWPRGVVDSTAFDLLGPLGWFEDSPLTSSLILSRSFFPFASQTLRFCFLL